MKTFVFFVICILSLLSVRTSFALQPSGRGDSATHTIRNSRTAILCSAIMPGLGQVYNRKYWKVPLVYGAGSAAIYSLNFYQSRYKKIMDFIYEDDDNKTYLFLGRNIESRYLPNYRDHYRHYRDISIFSIAAVYLLNIIDAMVDAEFTAFDVSDNLSLNFRPSVITNDEMTTAMALKLSIGF